MNLQVATIFVILAYCRNFAFGNEADDFFLKINSDHFLSNLIKLSLNEPLQDDLTLNKRLDKHDIKLKYLQKELDELNDDYLLDIQRTRSELFEDVEIYINQRFKEMADEIEKKESKAEKTELPRDCSEILARGNKTSGVYHIYPKLNEEGFPVWCDMTNQGGGWISILNRFDGSQNFFRNWTEYKEGFGELSGEHWLGLQHLHELTYSKQYELFIEMTDWNLAERFARYSHFKIGDESTGYRVDNIGQYSGNAGDSLQILGNKFSTLDRNQDAKYSRQYVPCAQTFKAGWWFDMCAKGILTGEFIPHAINNAQQISAITWETFKGIDYNLKTAQMLIRSTENK